MTQSSTTANICHPEDLARKTPAPARPGLPFLLEFGILAALFLALQNIFDYGGVIAVLLGTGAVAYFQHRRGETLSALGLVRPVGKRAWLKTIGATLAVIAAIFITSAIAQPAIAALTGSVDRALPDITTIGSLVLFLVISWTAAAFGEEIIFRGFFMTRIAGLLGGGRAGWFAAALAQAAIFGLGHAYQGLTGVLLTGSVGFVFGLAYLATGRKLLPLIIAHAIVDTLSVTILYMMANGMIAA